MLTHSYVKRYNKTYVHIEKKDKSSVYVCILLSLLIR